jgi:ABC-type microcin C transport system permease subunit YejE
MKPGIKTTEFLAVVSALIGTLVGATQGYLPPEWAAVVATVVPSVYAIARSLVKIFAPDVVIPDSPVPPAK